MDDEIVIKGSFALGIIGTFVNEEFGEGPIEILDSYEEVVEDYEEGHYTWHVSVMPMLLRATGIS